MVTSISENSRYPSTRFLGSKSKLIPWIHKNIKDLEFKTALDVFGGTGSFSYLVKLMGKKVFYNDILKFNQDIARAVIENKSVIVSEEEALEIINAKRKTRENIIESNFNGIYFRNRENRWLDIVIQNILDIRNKYKRSILLAALYQACLVKRPFNLFHRNNLYIRTSRVERNFGNKYTWETEFIDHFLRFLREYNECVFDNGKKNVVVGGYDALQIPRGKYDLVYLDPPYISDKNKINYLDYYHFLEGLSDYYNWENRIDYNSNNKRMHDRFDVDKWLDKTVIVHLFREIISKYKDSTIVMSYRNDGIPSTNQIKRLFESATGKTPKVRSIKYKYALSNGSTKEVLFIHEG